MFNREGGLFAKAAPVLTLVSPLADGADQMAAEAGLARGWRLQAILPFARATYIRDFDGHEAQARFISLIEGADCVLELPGDPDDDAEAYMAAGRATIAHCDLLIAIWDGKPPRGRGGTAEVVHLAVAQGTPVIHIPADGETPIALLWSGFDPNVVTRGGTTAGCASHSSPSCWGGCSLHCWLRRRNRTSASSTTVSWPKSHAGCRGRIEYPLLLVLAGVSRLEQQPLARIAMRGGDRRRSGYDFTGGSGNAMAISASLDLLERAYALERPAGRLLCPDLPQRPYLQLRAGGRAPSCSALSAFAIPASKLELAIVEFVVALAVIFNTKFGVRHEWHRRWLDYRQLAERLRPLRSLKLLGVAAPDPPGSPPIRSPRRWIDWYAAGVWRAMGCPTGGSTRRRRAARPDAISCHEIAPQIAYHEDERAPDRRSRPPARAGSAPGCSC